MLPSNGERPLLPRRLSFLQHNVAHGAFHTPTCFKTVIGFRSAITGTPLTRRRRWDPQKGFWFGPPAACWLSLPMLVALAIYKRVRQSMSLGH